MGVWAGSTCNSRAGRAGQTGRLTHSLNLEQLRTALTSNRCHGAALQGHCTVTAKTFAAGEQPVNDRWRIFPMMVVAYPRRLPSVWNRMSPRCPIAQETIEAGSGSTDDEA